MLQIDITGFDSKDNLQFKVNGNPSNDGNGKAHKGEDVQWKVQPGSGIGAIADIKMKTGSGAPPSINIFSSGPAPQGGGTQSQHWKGTVSLGVPDYAEYCYDIFWVKENTGETKKFDPKISIYPQRSIVMAIIIALVSILTGLFFFFRIKKKFNK
ncbi:MAG TPA: hypothetical protein VNS32_07445 [Flavisolibacter sp.]|nr:hypothetical protein [Flavisolibacter sp.]